MIDKKFTSDDFSKLDLHKHLLENQEMYFGSRGANPEHIATSIAEGALILGAHRTEIKEQDGWWYVCADIDWLAVSTIEPINEENAFQTLWAFGVAGVNWCRFEVFTRVFADKTFSVARGKVIRVKGDLPDDQTILEQVAALGSWQRVVAFHFCASPT